MLFFNKKEEPFVFVKDYGVLKEFSNELISTYCQCVGPNCECRRDEKVSKFIRSFESFLKFLVMDGEEKFVNDFESVKTYGPCGDFKESFRSEIRNVRNVIMKLREYLTEDEERTIQNVVDNATLNADRFIFGTKSDYTSDWKKEAVLK